MKRLFIILVAALAAVNVDAQITWPRKYATTVVRGRVNNLPADQTKVVTYMYQDPRDVVKNDRGYREVFEVTDSAGEFCFKTKICWPLTFTGNICDLAAIQEARHMVCPGDTIDIEIDYQKAMEFKDDMKRQLEEAITISGGTIKRSPDYIILHQKLWDNIARFNGTEIVKNYLHDFPAYQKKQWEIHQANLKELRASNLSKDEKELLEYALETYYIDAYKAYCGRMKYTIDSTKLAIAERDFTLKDPHAAELKSPRTINSVYYFPIKAMDYLQANGLAELPLGRYFQERSKVAEMVAKLKAQQNVPSEEIESLSPEFQQPLYELKAQIADVMLKDIWRPSGEQSTWLKQIVDRHKEKVVYVDYWATWCGPCQLGLREMAKVKEEYEKRGVDFVYITDDSSAAEGVMEIKKKHPGDHFIFTRDDIDKMNIPGYRQAIPHYLIYDRDGKLIKFILGWEDLEYMCNELDQALAR